jgi:transcriptional regulator with XRE-family HTH domain
MSHDNFTQFGRFLRRLRTLRGLSMRLVARLSQDVSPAVGEPISQGYISLLESGRPTKVAFSKLTTLAAIYHAPVRDIIEAAPPGLRPALMQRFSHWVDSSDVYVDPPHIADRPRQQRHQRIEDLFFLSARSVNIPGENPDGARRNLRGVLMMSVLPPLLMSSGKRIPRQFWRARVDQVRELLVRPNAGARGWDYVHSAFSEWIIGQDRLVDDMARLISWWTADYRASLISCHFANPAHEQSYGYDRAAVALIFGLRWGQTATILSRSAPPDLLLPPVPTPGEALYAYLVWLLRSRDSDPEAWRGATPALTAVVGLAADVARELPEILEAGSGLADDVRATAIRATARALAGIAPPRDSH